MHATVPISVDARDGVGIEKVEFYIDGVLRFSLVETAYMHA